jgi:GT2 family glycosyltransferase
MNDSVTVVVTSCDRVDLLERTMTSFLKYNTYPIDRYLLIDDSAKPLAFENIEKLNQKLGNIFELHFNYEKIGQVRSIDKMYSLVNTDYIFHLEDDWEFYRPDFIQKSIDILHFDKKIIQPVIRAKNDRYGAGISQEIFQTSSGIKYRRLHLVSYLVDPVTGRWVRNYGGFTLNPGLRRTSDYKLLPSYTSISDENGCEEPIDKFYQSLGYYVVSISEHDSDGYVRHIGWDKRTENHIW